jgi:hypothetical protein
MQWVYRYAYRLKTSNNARANFLWVLWTGTFILKRITCPAGWSVMESQMHQLNSITAKARAMKESIRANTTLSTEEQRRQIEWVDELCNQRIKELLGEDDHGTGKDETIRPE